MGVSRKRFFGSLLLLSIIWIFCTDLYIEVEIVVRSSLLQFLQTPVFPDSVYNVTADSQILILMWTNFRNRNFKEGLVDQCAQEYNCTLTKNRLLLAQSDAVLFHMRELDWWDIPLERSLEQYYVFVLWESPAHTYNNFKRSWRRSFFNLTMTYRRDSDVPVPYGEIVQIKSPLRLNLKSLLKNKTKPVAWMVSNCRSASKREKLVKELQKFIPVDIYGKCGSYTCDRDDDSFENRSSTCGHIFEQNYKFYLAFENSLCDDYVTEKLFFRFRRCLVPVVMERKNYEHFCPGYPEPWFIAVDDFRSVKDLANYLLYLHTNDSAYYEYLSWHVHYETVSYYTEMDQLSHKYWCNLCRVIAERKQKIIEDVSTWWMQDTCREGWRN